MNYKPLLWLGIVVTGLHLSSCVSNESAELDERFARNCEVIRANNAGFISENQDYSMYADDFFMVNTNLNGSPDTLRLEDLMAEDAYLWSKYDFQFLLDPVLLPGVDSETQEPNASVRYYAPMKISKAATDSSEERTVVVRMYQTFDLNEEGKITIQMYYGDFTAAGIYLNS
ncbi:MAG TPA: hypothetical protein DIT65_06875 [Cryomorphaceae bacterium]|nr:hypothetical protein [Cryomorphaceae bacterium]|tara:strand:+ start:8867 stop:9382 length:516 start_codon:yes stop_codon:yes gene_type:complete